MNIAVKKTTTISDGEHDGVIVGITYRNQSYEYVDLTIETKADGGEIVDLKCGFPQVISENSKLGILLAKFGANIEYGTEIDPDKVLIGRPCRFSTKNEINQKGKFARIVDTTIKPLQSKLTDLNAKI